LRNPAHVVLDVDYSGGAFEIVLVNIGAEVAHDVAVKFSRKVLGADGLVVTALPVFERLRTLRPDREIRVFIDTADALFRRRKTNAFSATVRWRDDAGQEHTARYRHDLDVYRSFPERI
jgi:hypothetical protein